MPASNPKEAKLDGDADTKKSENLDVSATQSALEEVEKCQNDLDTLNEKASEEILAVEQKYNKLRRPHYEKRNGVIAGIPDFWYNALINHPHIASVLSSGDQECLQALKSVTVEEFEDVKSGFKITFSFKENQFFTNTELVKECHLISSTSNSPEMKSTKIDWKDGKDLTKVSAQGKSRKRQFGGHSSFFSWFVKNGDPTIDELAEAIKDDIWMNPLQYYLASEIDISTENGLSDDDDEDGDLDESVVVIGDEDSEDDDDDEDGQNPEIFEVGDDDDDDDVEEIAGDDDDEEEEEEE